MSECVLYYVSVYTYNIFLVSLLRPGATAPSAPPLVTPLHPAVGYDDKKMRCCVSQCCSVIEWLRLVTTRTSIHNHKG